MLLKGLPMIINNTNSGTKRAPNTGIPRIMRTTNIRRESNPNNNNVKLKWLVKLNKLYFFSVLIAVILALISYYSFGSGLTIAILAGFLAIFLVVLIGFLLMSGWSEFFQLLSIPSLAERFGAATGVPWPR